MRRGKQSSGYTVVEVMIVLAVSGLIFLVAANFISSKQAKTSFKVGVTEMASRLQDAIEQVNDGHYTDKNFGCSVSSNSITIASSLAPPINSSQGSNSACVFLGNLLYFKQAATASAYQVIPLAGARLNSAGSPATSLAEVLPTAIVDPSGNPGALNLITDQTVPQNLDVTRVSVLNASGVSMGDTYTIGLVQGLGSRKKDASGTPTDTYDNGAQSISLVYTNDNNPPGSHTLSSPYALYTTHGARLCLSDGSRWALLTIGGQSDQLTVSTRYFTTQPAECPSGPPSIVSVGSI